jgi:putative transposase
MPIRERKHRLPPESYKGRVEVAFTACTKDRIPIFVEEGLVSKCVEILLRVCVNGQCEVLAYVFMPDHCHLLLRGKEETSDVLRSMSRFKQQTGYFFSQNGVRGRWQKDFYDHICRDEREVQKQIRYIVENPVREGLVTNWTDYKFKGSTVLDLDEW